MAIRYQWDCADKTATPAVGVNISVTTDDIVFDGDDTQISLLQPERVQVASTYLPIDKCTVTMEQSLDYPSSEAGPFTFRALFGNYSAAAGEVGEFMLCSFGDDQTMRLFFNGVSTNTEWAASAEVIAAHNDGALHEWKFTIDNEDPVNGASHIMLELDGALQTVTAGDITTPWTALNPTDDVYFGSADFTAYYGPNHMGNILVEAPGPTITITDPDQDIYPYNSSEEFDLPISGTYTLGTPAHVEYQIFRDDNDNVIQIDGNDWNTVGTEVIAGGNWSGVALGIPKTLGYIRIRVRYSDSVLVLGETILTTSVGFIGMLMGQSNPDNFFDEGVAIPNANTLMLPKGTTGGSEWLTMTGEGASLVANQLTVSLGCNVGLIDYGYDSSAIEEKNDLLLENWWLTDVDESDLYTAVKAGIAGIGGAVNHVFFYIGETESYAVNDQSTTEVAIEALVNDQLRVDIDYAGTGILPFTGSLLATWGTTSTNDVTWNAVNTAILNNFDVGVFDKICTPINSSKIDDFHIDPADYAPAVARAIEAQEGVETTYRSPRSIGWSIIDPETTDIVLDLDVGTDFTPTTGIDIFDINIGTIGSPNWISSTGARTDATTIRLTHATGTVAEARCLYGRLPDLTNIVLDNSTLTLPIIQESGISEYVAPPPVPEITITSPTSSSTYATSSSTISIGGTTSILSGTVDTVTWDNDVGSNGTCTGTTTWTQASISLEEGVNVLTVTATSDLAETNTDVLTVTYTVQPPGEYGPYEGASEDMANSLLSDIGFKGALPDMIFAALFSLGR